MKHILLCLTALIATPALSDQASLADTIATLARDTDPRYDPDVLPEDYMNVNQMTVEGCLVRMDTLVYFADPSRFVQHLLVSFDLTEATIDDVDGSLYQWNAPQMIGDVPRGIAQINFTAPETGQYHRQDSPPFGYDYRRRTARIKAPDAILYYRMEYGPSEQTVIDLVDALQTYKADYCTAG